MFCKKCGTQIEDDALFCYKCGEKTGAAQAADPAAEAPSDSSNNKTGFDPSKLTAAANNGIKALKSDRKLLMMAGGILALILVIIIVVVITALSGRKSSGGVTIPGVEGTFYFDRPLSINQIVEFGTYEQDGNSLNGKEPIKWRVLDKTNDRYLLVAHNVLDCQPWDDGSGGGSVGGLEHGSEFLYEDSSLRTWMNDYFSAEAFGEEELQYIIPVSFRNDVITVSKDNQYATDYAFILSANEVRDAFLNITAYWPDCAPPTEYALSQGANTIDVEEYYKNNIVFEGTKYPTTKDGKITLSQTLFGIGQTDYFDIGYVSSWHVRDTDGSQSYYTGVDGTYYTQNFSVKDGIRPAVYISADACYVKPVEVVEGQVSAVEAMSKYIGKYKGPIGWDATNTVDMTISQGFITIESMWMPYSANDDLLFIYFGRLEGDLLGRYNMSDFEYTIVDGNDCFTNYNRGVQFIYDSSEEKWLWYLNFPEGTGGLPEGKGDQWLLYHDLISEERFNSEKNAE